MVSCLAVFADGFESVEAIAPIDVLRRAGVEVTIAGLGKKEVVSAQGIKVITDVVLDYNLGLYDLIFLPGGMPGSVHLAESALVIDFIHKHNEAGKYIAAICAAPAKVLAPNGFLDGKKATCYPANMDEVANAAENATLLEDDVVVDNNIVTSRGVGTALELGYRLMELFFDVDVVKKMRVAMIADSF